MRRPNTLSALELLSSLRLCSNVPAQWAVQTALGGHQSIRELVSPGGRLYESRKAILNAVQNSRFLKLQPPAGAMYGFIGVDTSELPDFDDQRFALDLLEQKHVLIAPGRELQRAVPHPLPGDEPAGFGHASRCVRTDRRAADALRQCTRGTGQEQRGRGGHTLQVIASKEKLIILF